MGASPKKCVVCETGTTCSLVQAVNAAGVADQLLVDCVVVTGFRGNETCSGAHQDVQSEIMRSHRSSEPANWLTSIAMVMHRCITARVVPVTFFIVLGICCRSKAVPMR